MELNKWQRREAEQYAKDNGVDLAAAVKVLFPDDVAEVPAESEPEQLKVKTVK